MSGILPLRPDGGDERGDRPDIGLQQILTEEQRLGRWEVRAAEWRALELARTAFGPEVRATLLGMRHRGELRGLLKLDVPFADLGLHREREAAFLGMVGTDPLMIRVPLVFVLGPDGH